MFTEEPVRTELPSAAPFGPVYGPECGGSGLNIFLCVSCFSIFFLITTECP